MVLRRPIQPSAPQAAGLRGASFSGPAAPPLNRLPASRTLAAMPAPADFASFAAELDRLVEAFGRRLADLKRPTYVEAQLRDDSLNPFFRALGWDMENRAGLIQTKREVEIESRTRIGGRHKRADYLFRTATRDRFVCEAKKPAEDLGPRHAFQAKRYAWNKGVPLAVLTDFEEFKLFIVGGRPHLDEPDAGLWRRWRFDQLPAAARELWDLLARGPVADGAIDRLIESLPKRPVGRGRARQQWLLRPDRARALDADFLAFLDNARRELAADLLRHNDREALLAGSALNDAVHRILDRILFLRICEDRDIDTGERLDSLVQKWRRQHDRDEVGRRARQQPLAMSEEPPAWHGGAGLQAPRDSLWRAVVRHLRALDRRPPTHVPFFNGNLFKPHFSEELVVGDEWLAGFIGDLSDDESPYLFDVISVEILGSVYERFLGKVVRPHGRSVILEEKPEVRKAGGVYYTPRYIVDYIVEQTVGKLVEGRLPEPTLGLRVLDPACGSGSFLIRAFERLCEHWQRWLTDDFRRSRGDEAQTGKGSQSLLTSAPTAKEWQKKHRRLCWVNPDTGDLHLTADLKRRILTRNIYGVDLDAAAVEVTQLSLYLKMLEGENRTTLDRERELFPEAVALLPPLKDNIKCGNSLIASDFSMMPEDLVRVRAFDWPVQFEKIMQAGGFDAVIGNPPWIDLKGFDPVQTDYFFQAYSTVANRMNVYAVFMHRAVDLLRTDGRLGLITPNSFLTQSSYERLRDKLLALQVVAVVRTPDNVFDGVIAETAVSIYRRMKPDQRASILVYPTLATIDRIAADNGAVSRSIDQATWLERPSRIFNLYVDAGVNALLGMLGNCGNQMHEMCEFCLGLTPYDKAKGHTRSQIENRVFHSAIKKGKSWKPLLEGSDIQRFSVEFGGAEHINYGPWLGAPRSPKFFNEPRILVRQIISGVPGRIYAGYTEAELYNTQIAFNVLARPGTRESLKYVLAVLNSRLLTWFHRQQFLDPQKTTFQKILIQDARTFPIRRIDFSVAADKARHDRLVALVDKMLALMPRLRAATSESEKATLQNAVTATDRQIDALVYELYGLTPEEIALVEGDA